MKILVTIKRVPDADQKLNVEDHKLDLSKAQWQVNQFDEYALEAALRLTENINSPTVRLGEVVVVSIGPKEVEAQLKTCLAMGADRAILVRAQDDQLDAHSVASILAQIVKKESPDIVLMGKLAADGEGNEVGQRLAAYLDWPQATFASSIAIEGSGKTLLVGREIDEGTEYKKVTLPSVVTVDLRIIAPQAVQNRVNASPDTYSEGARYASLKGIMAAKKKPLLEMAASDLGISLHPYIQSLQVELPAPRKTGIFVASAAELIEKLHYEAKVI